jgi:hypothetical protein
VNFFRGILNKLNESYEDRVQQVVDAMNGAYPDGVSNDQFPEKLLLATKGMNIVELKPISGGSGTARKEFLKDVRKGVRKPKNTSGADRAKENEAKLSRVAQSIERWAGEVFPDGDPFDYIIRDLSKMGISQDNATEWMDKAARKYLGAKSYNGYLADLWDDVSKDSGDMLGIKPENNPWR